MLVVFADSKLLEHDAGQSAPFCRSTAPQSGPNTRLLCSEV